MTSMNLNFWLHLATIILIIVFEKVSTEETTDGPCLDMDINCAEMAANGRCHSNAKCMMQTCPVSCGKCGRECMDLHPDCGSWADMGECNKNSSAMNAICEKTCGLCHSTSGRYVTFEKESNKHAKGSHAFCYTEDSCGPGCSLWEGVCKTGQLQSPINIVSSDAIVEDGPLVNIPIIEFGAEEFYIQNNGHSVTVDFSPVGMNSSIFPGHGLSPVKYSFSSLHFHWGSTDNLGSEHTLDGQSFSMEMHFVHFRADFKGLKEALSSGESNALAVFGIFLQVDPSEKGNSELEPIIYSLFNIYERHVLWTKGDCIELAPLIKGTDGDIIYNYNGSLTTPECQQVVNWFVKKDPVKISSHDAAAFRKVKDEMDHPVKFNHRQTQPLNGRQITVMKTK